VKNKIVEIKLKIVRKIIVENKIKWWRKKSKIMGKNLVENKIKIVEKKTKKCKNL